MKETIKSLLKYAATIVVIFVLATFLRTQVFTIINVSGASMVPTLENHNMMVLNRLSYRMHEIERFDIVVVETPDNFIIKRVIGLPGDHIAYRDNQLYVNDEVVNEPHVVDKIQQYTYNFTLEELTGGQRVIPEDMYLVLGDNRPISEDSRAIGLVTSEQIIGKTNWVVWPPQDIHIAD